MLVLDYKSNRNNLNCFHFRAKMKHNLNPVMNAQLDRNRRFKTHRRNLSDPRFSTSLTDAYGEEEVNFVKLNYL